jgi:hypothetical protein
LQLQELDYDSELDEEIWTSIDISAIKFMNPDTLKEIDDDFKSEDNDAGKKKQKRASASFDEFSTLGPFYCRIVALGLKE